MTARGCCRRERFVHARATPAVDRIREFRPAASREVAYSQVGICEPGTAARLQFTDGDNLAGLGHGQHTQDEAVNEAEKDGVGGDADGQRRESRSR